MINKLKQCLIAICCILTSCNKVSNYSDERPALDLQSYFNGPIEAWGIVQDYKGQVVRRFKIEMEGRWDEDDGVLEEVFKFYDGEKQTRTWKIKRIDETTYEGRAGDILGKATGKLSGNAMQWTYRMDLKVGESTYRITFDDWMFMMEDDVLINRSYLKKFGLTVGELSIFMRKVSE